MDRRKRNWLISLSIVAIVAVFIAVRVISNSEIYLAWKAQYVSEDIKDIITENDTQWRAVAEAVINTCRTHDCDADYNLDTNKLTLYQASGESVISMESGAIAYPCEKTEVFDKIKGRYKDYYFYPAESCVFQRTIWCYDGIYCWVSLVYNERWEEILTEEKYIAYMESGDVIPVDSVWCIMIEYGY